MVDFFQEMSLMIPRGLDDFIEKILNREFADLFKNPEHFISIGSLLVITALFLMMTVTLR